MATKHYRRLRDDQHTGTSRHGQESPKMLSSLSPEGDSNAVAIPLIKQPYHRVAIEKAIVGCKNANMSGPDKREQGFVALIRWAMVLSLTQFVLKILAPPLGEHSEGA